MIPLIIVLAILLYIVEKWSMDSALTGVEYNYECSKKLLEPGEEFEIVTTITNHSRRFIPFIKVEELFPAEIVVKDVDFAMREDLKGNVRRLSTVYLMPRSKIVRNITASFDSRGRYIFRGGDLRGGDFLGLNENVEHWDLFREVVVYPKETDVADITSAMGGFLGDISVRRFIMEDPILTIGSRDYTGREPMKAISWSHSARVGKLMVKQFDHTIDPAVSVILDVESIDANNEETMAKREFCFSAARTICQRLDGEGMKYDFITNATTMDAFSRWSYKNEGMGSSHLAVIFEGLGRATHTSVEKLREIIGNLVNKQDYDRSVIMITIKSLPEFISDRNYLENRIGGKVFTISAGDYSQ